METEEVWKDIEGYPRYRVSNKGNVWSEKQNKLLKISVNNSGYAVTTLSNKGHSRSFRTHRLVAQAFIPNPDNLPEVNHIDEVKLNNCVENLEWCTREYNNNYRTANSKSRSNVGWRKKKPMVGTNVKTGEKIYFEGPAAVISAGFVRAQFSMGKYKKKRPNERKTCKGYVWDWATEGDSIEAYFKEVTTLGIYWGCIDDVSVGSVLDISVDYTTTFTLYLTDLKSVHRHKQGTIDFCLVNVTGLEVPEVYKDKPLDWMNRSGE